jgi:ferric-dicitrate binding protein FerR (iron transport regulator)
MRIYHKTTNQVERELISLISKFHQRSITDFELARLKMFVSQPEAQEILEDIDFPEFQLQHTTAIPTGMYEDVQQRISLSAGHRTGRIRKLWYAAAAASVLVVLTFTYWQLAKPSRKPVQWVDVAVPRGERKKILLPDSSVVYLNAGSRLSYPEKYTDSTRLAYLEGEAFFEITHDVGHPFIVRTTHTTTRVLGTRFNIEAYQREGITRVALVEGRVEVGDSLNKVILSPGSMMVHENNTGHQSVLLTEGNMAAWIKGELVFSGISLKEALQRVSEAYNITITMNSHLSNGYTITGHFQKEDPEKILDVLLAIHGLKWRKASEGYEVYQ